MEQVLFIWIFKYLDIIKDLTKTKKKKLKKKLKDIN